METLCIHSNITDPYFNLAAEEYFLKNFHQNIFILWRGETSIVVGKHQNALAEINHSFVRKNNIKVARRLSGGGTVFHDLGNLNFTFVQNVEKLQEVNFKIFTIPVVNALNSLKIDAYTSDRNDILIGGKKISGNAEHVHKNRVLHHGTLLYNSSLKELSYALKVDLSKFEDKAVQSNRSDVTNIVDHMEKVLSVKEFGNSIFNEIKSSYSNGVEYILNENDLQRIQKLSEEKYKTWDWIFGYSPRYVFNNLVQLEHGQLKISFKVEKGRINDFSLTGIKNHLISKKLDKKLNNVRHEYNAVLLAITSLEQDLVTEDIHPDELLNAFF